MVTLLLWYGRICCLLDEIHGDATEAVKFTTLTAEPDQPVPPRLVTKTKTSLQLKWNVSSAVRSACLNYCLVK